MGRQDKTKSGPLDLRRGRPSGRHDILAHEKRKPVPRRRRERRRLSHKAKRPNRVPTKLPGCNKEEKKASTPTTTIEVRLFKGASVGERVYPQKSVVN